MSSIETQVLIIGAGPAGTTLSYQLNKLNIPNIIIEKAKFPRHKLCAGALSARTLSLFDFDISTQIITHVDTAALHFRDTKPIIRKTDKPYVYIVNRYDFDDFLLGRAIETGTQVIYQDNWELKNNVIIVDDAEITFKYLIGADGAYSRVRRMLGLANSNGIGMEKFVPGITDDNALHIYYEQTENGYGWVFSAKGNDNSIGIAKLDNIKRKIKDDYISFQKKLNINGSIEAHVIPIFDRNNIYAKGNTALMGDAAQLCDHVLGEGIYYSIHSAHILAESIHESIREKKELVDIYASRLLPLLEDLNNSSKIAKIIYTYPALCHMLARFRPDIIDIYLNELRQQYSYTGLAEILKKNLYFLKYFFKIRKG